MPLLEIYTAQQNIKDNYRCCKEIYFILLNWMLEFFSYYLTKNLFSKEHLAHRWSVVQCSLFDYNRLFLFSAPWSCWNLWTTTHIHNFLDILSLSLQFLLHPSNFSLPCLQDSYNAIEKGHELPNIGRSKSDGYEPDSGTRLASSNTV